MVDYFSRYPEVIQLKFTTSLAVIQSPKESSADMKYIPEMLVSDNGPQYSSREFIEQYVGEVHIIT